VQTVAAQEGATRTVVGTYGYMPSEQFGGRTVPASDLYSLGATLIYLLTGIHPADLPQKDFCIQFEQKAKVSSAFSDWLRSMTEPNLEKRFDSAFQALHALDKNPNHFAINYPFSSRIELRKNSQFLEIIIPSKGFNFWVLLYSLIFSAILLLIGKMFLYSFLVAINLVNLLPIIYLFLVLSFISSNFRETRFNVSHQQITLTRELFGVIRFHLTPPSPREDIIKLVYFSEYVTQRQDENGGTSLVTVSAQLEIWAGIYKYRFPGTSINLPEYEVQLLAKELSNWLDLPILYANKQAEEN
jgi:serine/threonine protein kinase